MKLKTLRCAAKRTLLRGTDAERAACFSPRQVSAGRGISSERACGTRLKSREKEPRGSGVSVLPSNFLDQ